MSASRFVPTLLLVLLSAAGGALVAEGLRAPAPPPEAELLRAQSKRIEDLEGEVLRLGEKRASVGAASPEATSPRAAIENPVGAASEEHPVLAGSPHARVPAAEPNPEAGATSAAAALTTERGAPSLPGGRGAMLDLIRALAAGEVRQEDTALVGDAERLSTLFEPRAKGPTVRAEETAPEAEVQDGTTIVLDAGVYDFSRFSNSHRGAFPADVTFRGVGMDRTLLILNEVGATGEARNLGFEDLTLDTRGQYLADVRGDEPISLRFDRTRVIGFDQTPGGAVLLAARHGAVLARDARFEAGFGNAPGKGSFFHVRGPFLVRFERCTILGPFESLYEKSDRAAYAYVECRFEKMAPERRRDLETKDANVRFEACRIDYDPLGAETPQARARSELNPAWE